jgi:hypothetical protein
VLELLPVSSGVPPAAVCVPLEPLDAEPPELELAAPVAPPEPEPAEPPEVEPPVELEPPVLALATGV